MNIGDIFFTFRGESQQLIADAKAGGTKAGTAAATTFSGKFQLGLKSLFKGGLAAGAGVAAFNVLGSAISGVTNLIGDAVTAAMEEEAAIATLTKAVEENDASWDGNIDAIEEVIRAREELAFADDEQRQSLQSLVSVTGDVTKALEVQRTAMDLARLKGMDLGTATTLLGKVYAGNMGVLSRYGIQLEKGATATEAMAEIQRRAAGQAEAYADTAQGKMITAQIKLNDAMEDFGATLIPIVNELLPHLMNAIDLVADAFAQPSLQSKSFAAWAQGLDGVVESMEELTDATDEWKSGLGTFEDIWADTPLGFLAPNMAEAVTLWREYGEELEKVGLTFQDFKGGLNTIKMEMGVTTDEAVAMIREWAMMDDATTQATAAINAMAGELDRQIDALFGAGEAAEETTDDTDALTAAQERATRQAEKLADAMGMVAGISLESVRDEFTSVLEAAKEAAETPTWAVLNKQIRKLTRLQAKYEEAGEFKSAAIIAAYLEEAEAQRDAIRQVSRAGRAQQKVDDQRIADLVRIQTALGVTKKKALELYKAASKDPEMTILVNDRDLSTALTKINQLVNLAASTVWSAVPWGRTETRATGGPVSAGRPYLVNERTARSEWFVPSVPGRIVTHQQAALAVADSAGGGTTINLQTYGLPMRARTPLEVVSQLRRATTLGLLEPRRRTSFAGG